MMWPGAGGGWRACPRRENPGHLAFLQPRGAAPIKSMSVGPLSCPCRRHGPSPSHVLPRWRTYQVLPPALRIPGGVYGPQHSPARRDAFALPRTPKMSPRHARLPRPRWAEEEVKGPSASPLTPTAGGEPGISLSCS